MRKRLIEKTSQNSLPETSNWLDLQLLAEVEFTSEQNAYPIESALLLIDGPGWRAADPGLQEVRILFTEPQALKRIQLKFVETVAKRTQEFVIRWSADQGRTFQEIVRQQWNFSPDGSTVEIEDYPLDLVGVTALELAITPEIGGGEAFAALAQLRLA